MRWPEDLFGARWALGLSGGADSVALLHRCVEAGCRPLALHFNHGFADENGDEAERFCRDLCARLGVSLRVGRCAAPEAGPGSKEARARRARLAFFAMALREADATGILLAHQADDRAENLILRMARGCGADGLASFGWCGMLPTAPERRICRPLIDETHAAQVTWLQTRGLAWVEDVSNADLTIPRNAIRRVLTPLLPHMVAGMNASADLLAEENAFLATLAERAIVERTPGVLCLAEGTPPVLARRALRAWLLVAPTRRQVERLLALPVGAVIQTEGHVTVRRLSPAAFSQTPPARQTKSAHA